MPWRRDLQDARLWWSMSARERDTPSDPRMASWLWLVLLLAGCNVVQWQQSVHVGSLREAGLRSRQIEVGDATMRCWVRTGVGTPVLLLHGFGAPAHWQWVEQVAAFEGRPLVMPDLLWFGRSSSSTLDYSLDHQVRALTALLAELGLERVDVVGLSYGGLVAVELATAHPEQVRRLVLMDTPGRAYTHRDHDALLERFGVDHIGELMVPETDDDVRRMMAAAYAHPALAPDFALTQVREALYPPSRRPALYGVLDALERDLDRLRARPDPSAPTMIIWGRDDPVFPLAIARRLRRRLGPDTRLEVIDHARHTPNLEYPEQVNELLADFLADP